MKAPYKNNSAIRALLIRETDIVAAQSRGALLLFLYLPCSCNFKLPSFTHLEAMDDMFRLAAVKEAYGGQPKRKPFILL